MPQVRFLPGAPALTRLSCNYPFVKTNQNRSICAIFITKNSTKIAQKTHRFKKLILIILGCALFSGCASFDIRPDPWTREQILLQGAATALTLIDWRQTLYIEENPDKYFETNFILGKHPSEGRINTYFALVTGGKILATHYLIPTEWREWWLGANIVIEGYYVHGNFKIGVKIKH